MGFESRHLSHIFISRGSHLSDEPIGPKGLGWVVVKGLSSTYYLTLITNARILQLRASEKCQARHRPRSLYLYTAPETRSSKDPLCRTSRLYLANAIGPWSPMWHEVRYIAPCKSHRHSQELDMHKCHLSCQSAHQMSWHLATPHSSSVKKRGHSTIQINGRFWSGLIESLFKRHQQIPLLRQNIINLRIWTIDCAPLKCIRRIRNHCCLLLTMMLNATIRVQNVFRRFRVAGLGVVALESSRWASYVSRCLGMFYLPASIASSKIPQT